MTLNYLNTGVGPQTSGNCDYRLTPKANRSKARQSEAKGGKVRQSEANRGKTRQIKAKQSKVKHQIRRPRLAKAVKPLLKYRAQCQEQEWQYGTVRSEFAYYVPRTLNRTVPAYRTSIQFLKRTVPTYRTRNITKKAYCTSVPYFLAKI